MSLSRLWPVLAVALPVLMALLVPLPAVDLAYQVRTGDMILAAGGIPSVDAFTFTVAGAPWTDQQWLAQVLLSLGFRAGGWELLAVLRAVLVGSLSGLLVAAGLLRGASPRTASILALVAFLLASPALALRPQLLAIVAFAGLLVLVAGRSRYPRAYLAAPLLVIAWANLHGSFVLAPVLLGYAWLDDVAHRRPTRGSLAVLLAGTVATLVNPFGLGAWSYAIGIGANPVITSRVSEWQRTLPSTVPGLLFYVSAAAAAGIAWRGRRRLAWADALWLAAMVGLGVSAVRGLAWWPAGAAFVVAAALADPTAEPAVEPAAEPPARGPHLRPEPRGMARLNAALVVVLGCVIVAALPWWRPADPLTGRVGLLTYAPSGLAAQLRKLTSPGTKVFVPETWGSWFEWAVPDVRYFVDSRFELYPATVWADLDAIGRGGAQASAALDRRGVEVVVVPAGWTAPAGGWTSAFTDLDGSILIRASAIRSGWYLRATEPPGGVLLGSVQPPGRWAA